MTNLNLTIKYYKKYLIRKATKNGMYENFGQKEVSILENTYRDYQYKNDGVWDKIREFDNWCMNYTG